jgi:hypothetical protein
MLSRVYSFHNPTCPSRPLSYDRTAPPHRLSKRVADESSVTSPNVTDLTEQQEEIRSRYPEYGHHPAMIREMAALWGDPPHNENGVLETTERLSILEGQKQWKAEVRLAQTPSGRYAMSTSHQYPSGGGSSAPGVGDHRAYLSRDAAIEAGYNELIKRFAGVRDWKGTRPHTEPIIAEKMIEHLEKLKGRSNQMTLF